MRRNVLRYGAAFAVSVCIAMLLLFLAACIPQHLVDANVVQSADRMMEDGLYPTVFDKADTARLDNWTDAIILAQCKAMSVSQPGTMLTNPMYETVEQNPVVNLYEYVHGDDPQPTSFYARYWMGFRAVIRSLLAFLDYNQILRYLAVAVLVLWAAAVCSVAHHTDAGKAFVFAVSIVLVRPQIVVMSIQYSCCFLIAFGAMLLVPWLEKHPKQDGMFFFLIGILTMYFDFYTTPAITFCLPMMYLYLLRGKNGGEGRIRMGTALKYVMLWAVGYVGMWFAKMVLTSVFTDVNGLQNGLQSMLYRLGVKKPEGQEASYRLIEAVRAVWYALYSDKDGEVILLLAGSAGAVWLIAKCIRCRVRIPDMKENATLLLLAAVPVVWMLAAPQATYIHYWFQYRSISASFWGAGLYCMMTLEAARQRQLKPTE